MSEPGNRAPGIFSDALELPAAERARFLDAACSGDSALRAEVASLLAGMPAAEALFAQQPPFPPAAEAAGADDDPTVGRVIGPWRVGARIATGGMGAVYHAERVDDAYEKKAAIKLIRPGFDTRELLERFRRERQLLASLEHPHIARLLDGGSTPEGQPYLVMEFVDGLPIDRWCDEQQLGVRARIQRFLGVCEAVQFAHRNLVVHRDLKPGNIMVDREGRVKLLDFGIAKLLGDGGEAQELTHTSARAFSPRYASPEQVSGAAITTASDVYGLGVVLYELLAGASPYSATRTAIELERAVLTEQIPPPSRRATGPRVRELSGDLDTIVLRALSREPARRYGSVQELADDLRRHLAGEPVLARPDTATYRFTSFARRNRALVTGVAVALVALTVALAVTALALRESRRNAREAEWLAYSSSLAAAEASIAGNQMGEAARRLAQAPARLREWEWRHLFARLDRSRAHWPAHSRGITRVRFSRDGLRLATSSIDGMVKLWNAANGDSLAAWGPFGMEAECAVPSPDGQSLAIGLGDGRVLIATMGVAEPRLLARGAGWALVDFSPAGDQLVAGFEDGRVAVYDVASGAERASWRAHEDFALPQWSPRGDRIATGGGDAMVKLWDASGRRMAGVRAHDRRVYAISWSADGTKLVTGSMDRTATVWNAATLEAVTTFQEHAGTVAGVAFSPDGARVLSSGADGRVLVWDSATRALLAELRGHQSDVSAVAIAPGSGDMVTGDWGGEVRVWPANAEDVRTLRLPAEVNMVPTPFEVRFSPSGSRVAAVANPSGLVEWDVPGGNLLSSHPELPARRVVFTSDSTRLLLSDSGLLYGWPARDSSRSQTPDGAQPALDVHLASRLVATAGADSTVRLYSLDGLRLRSTLGRHEGAVRDVAFSPDGLTLASAGRDSVVRLWDVRSGKLLRVLRGHLDSVSDVAWHPDGLHLASASRDGSVRLWDAPSGRLDAVLVQIRTNFSAVAFSPDGQRLAAGSSDQLVRLFDLPTRRELLALRGHSGQILSLTFSADGTRLASASLDGTVRLWEAPPAGSHAAR